MIKVKKYYKGDKNIQNGEKGKKSLHQ